MISSQWTHNNYSFWEILAIITCFNRHGNTACASVHTNHLFQSYQTMPAYWLYHITYVSNYWAWYIRVRSFVYIKGINLNLNEPDQDQINAPICLTSVNIRHEAPILGYFSKMTFLVSKRNMFVEKNDRNTSPGYTVEGQLIMSHSLKS